MEGWYHIIVVDCYQDFILGFDSKGCITKSKKISPHYYYKTPKLGQKNNY